LNVKRALDTDGTLACYVSLMMSQLGHSPDVIFIERNRGNIENSGIWMGECCFQSHQ